MSLKVYCGCMFSGKSTMAIFEAKRYLSIGMNVLSINHSFDDRYSETKSISTHYKEELPGISLNDLSSLKNDKDLLVNYKSSNVIVIDEGQFFNNLVDNVLSFLKDKKHVIVSGLDLDAEKKVFGQMVELGLYADEFTKLSSYCTLCKAHGKTNISAHFTKFIKQKTEITDNETEITDNEKGDNKIVIGGIESYIPVCSEHFHDDETTLRGTLTVIVGPRFSGKSQYLEQQKRDATLAKQEHNLIFMDNVHKLEETALMLKIEQYLKDGKNVFVSGAKMCLETQKPFPLMIKLCALAEKLVYLKSLCVVSKDGTEAVFDSAVGPVCRKYLN